MFTEHDHKMAFDDGYVEGHKNGFDAGLQVARPKWISVEERLPKESGNVLVVLFGNVSIACYELHRIFKTLGGVVYWPGDVTHWMPLPAPPKEDKGE